MRRTALITGGSVGIGAAIARRFGYDGVQVLVHYRGEPKAAASVVDDILSAGGDAVAIQANVADSRSGQDLFDFAEARYGAVDILVNCANVVREAPLAQVSDEMFELVLAVNLFGSFYTMREAARRMKRGGRIVNISSSEMHENAPGYCSYNAAKGAVEAITRVLANELSLKGITVNAVAVPPERAEPGGPGPNQTDTIPPGLRAQDAEAPTDILRLVSFLVSEKASWIQGQVLRARRDFV